MPAVSPEQKRLMQAVSHNPKFAKKVGIPQSVGRKFDHYAEGGQVDDDSWLWGDAVEMQKGGRAKKIIEPVSRAYSRFTDENIDPRVWFGKSLVVDENGKPLIVYRGEHGITEEGLRARTGLAVPTTGHAPSREEIGYRDFHSLLPSLSFGTRNAANAYAMQPNDWRMTPEAPRVTPAYLRIERPIHNDIDDPFMDFSMIGEKLSPDIAASMARRYSDFITNTNNWHENFSSFDSVDDMLKRKPKRLNDLYVDIYPLLDDPDFVKAAKLKGYDGAIHGGAGETALEPEYRIFDEDNALSAIKHRMNFGGGGRVRRNVEFTPDLDTYFGEHSKKAGALVRRHTEKTGKEGGSFGNEFMHVPLIRGERTMVNLNAGTSPFTGFVQDMDRQAMPFFSIHSHPVISAAGKNLTLREAARAMDMRFLGGSLWPSGADLGIANISPNHTMMIESAGLPNNRLMIEPPETQDHFSEGRAFIDKLPSFFEGRSDFGPRLVDFNRGVGLWPGDPFPLDLMISKGLAARDVPIHIDDRAQSGSAGAKGYVRATDLLPEFEGYLSRHNAELW